jgi:hypothetical protein
VCGGDLIVIVIVEVGGYSLAVLTTHFATRRRHHRRVGQATAGPVFDLALMPTSA